jgi:enolase
VGDEGGFAPNLKSADEALGFLARACEKPGYRPGEDVTFALDCASTEFFRDGRYVMEGEGKTFDAAGMVAYLKGLCDRYPIVSIEDGCAEDDWDGWKLLTDTLSSTVQLVGADLFVTNPARLRRGIATGTANAILVKVNQIGSPTETLEAVELAHRAGFRAVMIGRTGTGFVRRWAASSTRCFGAVSRVMAQTPRSGSLVENLNSRLRTYFALRHRLVRR